jgi:hypothetical protein
MREFIAALSRVGAFEIRTWIDESKRKSTGIVERKNRGRRDGF